MKFALNKTYLVISVILFIIEVLIACYLKTGFIRHTLGDYLVVIFIYSLIKTFIKNYTNTIALGVLVLAFLVEFMQLFNVLDFFNIQNKIVRIILGTTFQATDLVAYTLGFLTVIIIEKSRDDTY